MLELQPTISRLFSFWAFVNSAIFLCLWRLAFRRVLYSKGWATMLKDRVLVVGWSKESDNLARQMREERGHPYEIIGCTPSAHGKFWVTPPRDIPSWAITIRPASFSSATSRISSSSPTSIPSWARSSRWRSSVRWSMCSSR